jgi:hypothetical protein
MHVSSFIWKTFSKILIFIVCLMRDYEGWLVVLLYLFSQIERRIYIDRYSHYHYTTSGKKHFVWRSFIKKRRNVHRPYAHLIYEFKHLQLAEQAPFS